MMRLFYGCASVSTIHDNSRGFGVVSSARIGQAECKLRELGSIHILCGLECDTPLLLFNHLSSTVFRSRLVFCAAICLHLSLIQAHIRDKCTSGRNRVDLYLLLVLTSSAKYELR